MLITEDTPLMKTATAPKKRKKSTSDKLPPGTVASFAARYGMNGPVKNWNAADYIRELRKGR